MNEEKRILELVGGEENVISVSHCMTRLRFVLKDEKKANIEELEKITVVKGTFTQAGQFQVIIGNSVADVFKKMIENTDLNSVSKEDIKKVGTKKMNIFQRGSSYLSEIFVPIIPAIIVGGLLLGFRNMLELPFPFLDNNSFIEINQFAAGLDSFLWLICEAIFMYLPVHVCWSTVKKVGGTEVLGIVLGICLVSPQLLSAYDVASTPADQIPFWDFGFAKINMIGYQAQVVPSLLVGLFAGHFELKLRKIVPDSIKMIVIPFLVLVITTILAMVVIGPFGWWIGTLIANTFIWLFENLSVFGGMIFGFLYAPLVITGLHHTTIAIDLQIIAQTGSTPMWPLIALSNIAQGSAVLGIILMNRTTYSRELTIPATISAYLGVTEPALYGVNLKYVFPLFCGMIGSAAAAGYARLMDIQALAIGVGGYPGILSIRVEDMLNFLIAMIIATAVPLILTMAMYKRKGL